MDINGTKQMRITQLHEDRSSETDQLMAFYLLPFAADAPAALAMDQNGADIVAPVGTTSAQRIEAAIKSAKAFTDAEKTAALHERGLDAALPVPDGCETAAKSRTIARLRLQLAYNQHKPRTPTRHVNVLQFSPRRHGPAR